MTVFARRTCLLLAAASLALSGCGDGGTGTVKDLNMRQVTLPGGTRIRAELVTNEVDLARGLKYRDSLAENAGMLFAYGKPGFYRFWMHEVKFPIDILWLDSQRRIVQLVHNLPPCPGPAQSCPSYGGDFSALYVLELNSGMAKKHNLKPGMVIDF